MQMFNISAASNKKKTKQGENYRQRLISTAEVLLFLKQEFNKYDLPITKKTALKMISDKFRVSSPTAGKHLKVAAEQSSYISESIISTHAHKSQIFNGTRLKGIPLNQWEKGITSRQLKEIMGLDRIETAVNSLERMIEFEWVKKDKGKFFITEKGINYYRGND